MSTEHTIRGKMVRLRGIEANVREDGTVHVTTGQPVDPGGILTEQAAIDLYRVLSDVIEYGPGDGTGTTEGATLREMDANE